MISAPLGLKLLQMYVCMFTLEDKTWISNVNIEFSLEYILTFQSDTSPFVSNNILRLICRSKESSVWGTVPDAIGDIDCPRF